MLIAIAYFSCDLQDFRFVTDPSEYKLLDYVVCSSSLDTLIFIDNNSPMQVVYQKRNLHHQEAH